MSGDLPTVAVLRRGNTPVVADALAGTGAQYLALIEPGDRPEPLPVWQQAISTALRARSARPPASVIVGDEVQHRAGVTERVHTPVPDRFSALTRPVTGGPYLIEVAAAREAGWDPTLPDDLLWADLVHRLIAGGVALRCDEVLIRRTFARPTLPIGTVLEFIQSREPVTGIGAAVLDGRARLVGAGTSTATVSIVIPTVGSTGVIEGEPVVFVLNLLEQLLEDLPPETAEVLIVVDSATPAPVREALIELARGPSSRPVRLIDDEATTFSFSHKVNLAATHAAGSALLLLNDDTAPVSPNWLGDMCDLLRIEGVGVVGATLLYEDDVVQHAGVTGVDGFPDHFGKGRPHHSTFCNGLWWTDRSATAVTGAVMLTTTDLWERIGGFSPALPVNYNDVDYCLKARAEGADVVMSAAAVLRHFESRSREARVEPDEMAVLAARWHELLVADPHHPGGAAVVVADWRDGDQPLPPGGPVHQFVSGVVRRVVPPATLARWRARRSTLPGVVRS